MARAQWKDYLFGPLDQTTTVIDRAHIGRTWPSWEVEVEKGRLRLLAEAIGETRPEYTDEAAARRAGYRSIVAPPTFAYCLGADDPGGLAFLAELGIPVSRLLHGEQRITIHEPICAGDRVRVTRRVKDIYSKKNGVLEFVVWEIAVDAVADGRPLARNESILVVRNG